MAPSPAVPLNRGQRRAASRNRAPSIAPPRRLAGISVGAEWLNCDERTVRRMIQRGELSGFRVGRHLKIDLNEIEAKMVPVVPESVSG